MKCELRLCIVAKDFKWTGDLEGNLAELPMKMRAAVVVAATKIAPDAESWMKSNAPWTDQTGNARNGLRARAEHSARSSKVVLSHSVPYGIWLEVRWSGRYAVIGPAIERFAPQFMALAARLIFK
jgi:hypothetical protein